MTTAISQSTDHAALLRLEKQYKAVSGGGGNITVSVKRNPPKGFIRCSGVKITRKNGRTEVRIRK